MQEEASSQDTADSQENPSSQEGSGSQGVEEPQEGDGAQEAEEPSSENNTDSDSSASEEDFPADSEGSLNLLSNEEEGVITPLATPSVGNETALRNAVAAAGSPHTITLTADIQLTGSPLIIAAGQNITLQGSGKKLIGANGSSTIDIAEGATLTFNGITMTHNSGETGIGLNVNGTLNLVSGEISGNTNGGIGGGMYVRGSGTLNMSGGLITNNNSGGVGGGICSNGTINMTGGTISNNSAAGGGGVWISTSNRTFTMSGSARIEGNKALSGMGGGVGGHQTAIFIMKGGTLANNTAAVAGGGASCTADEFFTIRIEGGTISGNSAPIGGAVYSANYNNLSVAYGAVFSGNSASSTYSGSVTDLPSALSTIYASQIKSTSWTSPFAQGYNNADINVDTRSVTFNGNGGTVASANTTRSTYPGTSLGSLPPDPTRTGYSFAGWNTVQTGGASTAFTSATAVSDNITVYAQWTIQTRTVTFNANGGEFSAGVTTQQKTTNYNTALGASNMASTPTRTGYTFASWNTNAQGTGAAFTNATLVPNNIPVYAVWTIQTRTVTFDANEGSFSAGVTMQQKSTNYNTTLGANMASTPTRTGYSFASWNTAANGSGAEFTNATLVPDNITVYAKWTLNSYTVTFRNYDNTAVTTKTVNHGAQVGTLPSVPARTGYSFSGWFTSVSGGTQISATTVINAEVSYYAHYSLQTRTVTFNANGGEFSAGVTTQQKTTNYNTALGSGNMASTPTRTGYTFASWNTNAQGTGVAFIETTLVPDNVTVFAVWTVQGRTVTFDANGGEFSAGVATQAKTTNYHTALGTSNMASIPTRTGYSFDSWNTQQTGGGAEFTNATLVEDSITVYAQWTIQTRTVTFNANGGEFSAGVTTQQKTTNYNTALGASNMASTPTRTGYTFASWNTNAQGTGAAFTNATLVPNNIPVYAVWTIQTRTVTFDANEGTFSAGATMQQKSTNYNTTLGSANMADTPTRTGYSFASWNTAANGSGNTFTASTPVAENLRVYAIWTLQTRMVTFNAAGGEFSVGVATQVKSTDYSTALGSANMADTPTRTGYSFIGWSTTNGGSANFTNATLVENNITVYACWSVQSRSVIFNGNGGTVEGAANVTRSTTYDTPLGASNMPTTPVREGYTFASWNTRADGTGTTFSATTSVTEEVQVYAKWTRNTYTVTFDSQGGVALPADAKRSVEWNTSLEGAMPASPVRAGHGFAGWWTNVGGTGAEFTQYSPVTAHVTVYAYWTVNTYTATFDADGGEFSSGVTIVPKTIAYNTSFGATNMPPVPTREGYTFANWYTASEGSGTLFTETTRVTANMSLFANWTRNNYTVTFDTQGGSALPLGNTRTTPWDTYLGDAMPGIPTKAGHSFASWNTKADGTGDLFTEYSPVKEHIVVYAQWTVNPYTVTFNGNGGEFAPNTTTHNEISNYNTALGASKMPTPPTQVGHSFAGWYTTSTGGNSFSATTLIMGNITVYAHWTLDTYTVTFDAQGGEVDGRERAVRSTSWNTTLGTNMPLAPTREGHSFQGWFTGTGGTGDEFEADSSVVGDITLYAHWTLVEYTVTFDGGRVDNGTDLVPVTLGANYTPLTVSWGSPLGTAGMHDDPEFTGCAFASWNTEIDGSGTTFSSATPVTQDTTLYAIWTIPTTYMISFEAQGGVIEAGNATRPVTLGESLKSDPAAAVRPVHGMPPAPTRVGYDFKEWNFSSDGLGAVFTEDTPLETPNSITVYAIWQVEQRTVTFNANGGALAGGDETHESDYGFALGDDMPANPTREGYSFREWNTATDGTGDYFSAATPVREDMTVYALWDILTFTVVFEGNGIALDSGEYAPVTLNWGDSLGEEAMPDPPTREGHNFSAWNTQADGSGDSFTSTTPVTENITVYAKWSDPFTFTVTFMGEGGSIGGVPTTTRESSWNTGLGENMPATPVREGYTFLNWVTATDGTGTLFSASTPVTESLTVYATWALQERTVTFDGGGATLGASETSRSTNYGTSLGAAMPANPTREGYDFREWVTATDGTGESFSATTLVTHDITVYATWTAQKRTITFNGGGTILDLDDMTRETDYGTSLGANMPADPTREGYTFSSWVVTRDGTTTTFTAATLVTENIEVHATWTIQTRTVTFDGNGTTLDASAYAPRTPEWNSSLGADMPADPTREGHTFLEWSTALDAAGTVFDRDTPVTAHITVYARWSVNSYTVTFEGNGGVVEPLNATRSAAWGSSLGGTLPPEPEREGHSFASWNTEADGSGTSFDATTLVTGDTRVYARWQIDTYTVTFDGADGVVLPENVSRTAEWGSSLGASMPVAVPTRIGYSFDSWRTAAGGLGDAFTENTPVTADITVYARWTPVIHTITFDGNGGEVSATDATRDVAYGSSLGSAMPPDPTREGHHFSGWSTASDGTGIPFGATSVVTGNITVYATWALESRSVTFDANNGEFSAGVTTETRSTDYHTALGASGMPSSPTRAGHDFKAWNSSPDGTGDVFTDATIVDDNVTVYATWTLQSRTVTFDGQGGEIDGDASTTRNTLWNTSLGTSLMPLPPTRQGHTFDGWYTEVVGGTLFDETTLVTDNISVYAHWQIDSYTVTFDAAGGVALPSDATRTLAWNTSLGAGMPDLPVRVGHSFVGWYTGTGGTGDVFTRYTSVTGNMRVYAYWQIDTYTVTFEGAGGVVLPSNSSRTVEWGSSLGTNMPVAVPTRTGHTFDSWNTAADATGDSFTFETLVTGDITVYAIWTPDIHTVTFDGNGGEVSLTDATRDVAYGSSLGLSMPTNAPTREGHRFSGWSTASDGTGIPFGATSVVTGNITVYATWALESRSVTFDANNGEFSAGVTTETRSTDYRTALGASGMPAPPTRAGHDFKAWNTRADGTGDAFTDSTLVEDDTTVYATWIVRSRTVTFNGQGGETDGNASTTRTTTYNTSLGTSLMPTPPIREGYTFEGWYTEIIGGTLFDETTLVTDNISVYAHWQIDTYTVTFDAAGGVALPFDDSRSVAWNSSLGAGMPPNPARAGHSFVGWYTGTGGTGDVFTEYTLVTGNMRVYAHWQIDTYTVTFDAQGGTILSQNSSRTAEWGSALGASMPQDIPTRAGHTFDSWNTAADATGESFTFETLVTANLTVYAIWTPDIHTVTFDGNGGEVSLTDATRDVAYGSSLGLSMPTNAPTRAGHRFSGWNTTTDGTGIPFDASFVVTGDITVYADWALESRTVIFDANNGEFSVSTVTETRNTDYNTALGASGMPAHPVRAGHDFDSWNTRADGTGDTFDEATLVTDNLTVYAIWITQSRTVTFDGQGGETDGYPTTTRNISWNTSLGAAKMPTPPVKEGFTFEGWYTEVMAGTLFDETTLVTEDTTVYARWAIATYTVTFDAAGGVVLPSDATRTIAWNTSLGEDMPADPAREGHAFVGWYTSAGGLGDAFTKDTLVVSDITVYAHWQIESYTVTFDGAGGVVLPENLTRSAVWNTSLGEDMPIGAPTRVGYDFSGWNTAVDGSGSPFTDTTPVTADITLYATWTAQMRSVTFDGNGGTFALSADEDVPVVTRDIAYDSSFGASMPESPTRSGYTFVGWNTADDGTGDAFTDTTPVTVDITVYALWACPPSVVLYEAYLAFNHDTGAFTEVTLTGRVTYIGNPYVTSLRYREQGSVTWVTLDAGTITSALTSDFSLNASIPASSLRPGVNYEVMLVATNDTSDALTSAASVFFCVPVPPDPERLVSLEGVVENATDEPITVTLTLARGSVAQASSVLVDIPAAVGGINGHAFYSFVGEFSGGYNLVAEAAEVAGAPGYKITRGVYVEGADKTGPTFIFDTQGRTQSRVDVGASVPAVSADGLPALFEEDTLYTADDKMVVSSGGMVEFVLLVNEVGATTEGALTDAALARNMRVALTLDIRLEKRVYPADGTLPVVTDVTDTAARALTITIPIPEALQSHIFSAVLRLHETSFDVILKREASPQGEYFEQAETFVTLHTSRFSGYALAEDIPENEGGTPGGSTPGGSSGSGATFPKVGDTTPLIPLAVITTLSVASLGVACYRRRRRS